MKQKGILIVSYGTSSEVAKKEVLDQLYHKTKLLAPNFNVKEAYTSDFLRGAWQKRGVTLMSVEDALEAFVEEGVGELRIIPTHFIGGGQYTMLVEQVANYKALFHTIEVAKPLLECKNNRDELLMHLWEEYGTLEGGIVLLGHGAKKTSNEAYHYLQKTIDEKGYKTFCVTTLEDTDNKQKIKDKLLQLNTKKLYIIPLMLTAGHHVFYDLIEKETSYRAYFEGQGYEVTVIPKGIGSEEWAIQMYWKPLKDWVALDDK